MNNSQVKLGLFLRGDQFVSSILTVKNIGVCPWSTPLIPMLPPKRVYVVSHAAHFP